MREGERKEEVTNTVTNMERERGVREGGRKEEVEVNKRERRREREGERKRERKRKGSASIRGRIS